MLKYLVVILDDTSVSYCHYNTPTKKRLMPLDVLHECILYGMKENLYIQFILPNYKLPKEYWGEMNQIDHTLIMSSNFDIHEVTSKNNFYRYPDVIVIDGICNLDKCIFRQGQSYILRIGKSDLAQNYKYIAQCFNQVARLNIVLNGADDITEGDFIEYKTVLEYFAHVLEKLYANGQRPQINILTDRIFVDSMNNCGAGETSIAIAPDGKIYPCPAFYQDHIEDCNDFILGNVRDGLSIKNSALFKLDHAPLCRNCDAYQCKRCVWLNKKLTKEINIPSHEQCVMAHLERNASRLLLYNIRKCADFMKDIDIKEISYLDPFDVKPEL